MKGKTTVTAIDTVNGGETETFEHEFKRTGFVTGIRVSTYVGQEFDLQYTFEKVQNDTPSNLLDPLGVAFVAGNGEELDLPVREKFEEGDVLRITVENVEPDFQYHASARVPVDYGGSGGFLSIGGSSGLLGGVLNG